LLSCVGIGLEIVRVRPEVELIGGVRVVVRDEVGVRVVVGDRVGVRVVLGGDLLPSPTCGEILRVGLASDAEVVWEVLMEWGVRTMA
jgi:hypothetical protein